MGIIIVIGIYEKLDIGLIVFDIINIIVKNVVFWNY